jgi:hypothetical protein
VDLPAACLFLVILGCLGLSAAWKRVPRLISRARLARIVRWRLLLRDADFGVQQPLFLNVQCADADRPKPALQLKLRAWRRRSERNFSWLTARTSACVFARSSAPAALRARVRHTRSSCFIVQRTAARRFGLPSQRSLSPSAAVQPAGGGATTYQPTHHHRLGKWEVWGGVGGGI